MLSRVIVGGRHRLIGHAAIALPSRRAAILRSSSITTSRSPSVIVGQPFLQGGQPYCPPAARSRRSGRCSRIAARGGVPGRQRGGVGRRDPGLFERKSTLSPASPAAFSPIRDDGPLARPVTALLIICSPTSQIGDMRIGASA